MKTEIRDVCRLFARMNTTSERHIKRGCIEYLIDTLVYSILLFYATYSSSIHTNEYVRHFQDDSLSTLFLRFCCNVQLIL